MDSKVASRCASRGCATSGSGKPGEIAEPAKEILVRSGFPLALHKEDSGYLSRSPVWHPVGDE
jgi:hypothetical protein